MVVELHTADGKIKRYDTIYEVGTHYVDLYHTDKYVANCGQEWKKKPNEHEECDHLDCAIYLAKREMDSGPKGFALTIAFTAIGIIVFGNEVLVLSGFFILLAFAILISGLRAGNQFNELNEYKNKGTIKGVKAFQIRRWFPILIDLALLIPS